MSAPPLVSCPHARTCGACALLGATLDEQLSHEESVVARALASWDDLEGLMPERCIPSPLQQGYRNRAKMAFEDLGREGIALGYFQPRSRVVVDAPDCQVLVPEILEATRSLRRLLSRRGTAPESLRFVDVRCGSDPRRQHVTLVLGSAREDVPVDEIRRACPHVAGISVNVNPGAGSQVIKGPVSSLWGEPDILVELPGARLRVSAGSFFQVNLAMLEIVQEEMRAFLGHGTVLADLYAGVGTHGLALREGFERVILVEGVTSAVRDARASVAASHARGVTVMGAPVERAMGHVQSQEADAVVMNPSREGCKPLVLDSLVDSPASRIAYLSCEPVTLARDIVRLVRGGFQIEAVIPLQMMPQTGQVEALALLSRATRRRAPARERDDGRAPARGAARLPGRDRKR